MAKEVRLDEHGYRKFGARDKIAYAAGDFGCNMSFALKGTLTVFWTQYMGISEAGMAMLLVLVQVWDKIAYAAGDFGCNMSFALKGTLTVFWTQYMGISEAGMAMLLVLVQVWDAINDPVIGSMVDADKHHYKRNKFLQYIWVGSIGLLVAGALCFVPWKSAPYLVKNILFVAGYVIWDARNKFLQYIWVGSIGLLVAGALCFVPWKSAPYLVKNILFVAGYVIWDAFYTIANVPYGSLLSLITKDPVERAELSSFRSIGSTVGSMLPMVLLPMLIYDASNTLRGERIFLIALVMGVLGLISFQFMIRNTVVRVDSDVKCNEEEAPKFNVFKAMGNFLRNRAAVGAMISFQFMIRNTVVRVDSDVKCNEEEAPKFNVFKAMGNFLRNRAAVGATLSPVGTFLGMAGAGVAATVMFQAYFQNARISGLIQMFSMVGMLIFLPLVKPIVKKFGKKEACTVGALISVGAYVLMLVLPITPDGKGGMLIFLPLVKPIVKKFGKKEACTVGALISVGAYVLMLVLPITPDGKGLALFVMCQIINALGAGVGGCVSWSLMADAMDYGEWKFGVREEGTTYALHSFFRKLAQGIGPSWSLMADAMDYGEWKFGVREEGTTYALHSFFRKLAQGIGPSLGLMAATWLGYRAALGPAQPFEVALRMRYLVACMYLLSAVLQFVGLGLVYNLDKKTLATIEADLEARKQANA